MQGGHEDLFDIGEEAAPSMAPSKTPGAVRPVTRSAARNVLPPGARRVVVDAGPAEGPTIPPQEIVRNAGFIEKNQACRIPGRRGGVPHDPRGRDVRSIVFGGPDRFFDGHVQSRHRAPDRRQTGGVPSASFSSAKVRLEARVLEELVGRVEQQKVRQTLCLDHLYRESLRAWEASKADATRRVQKKTQPGWELSARRWPSSLLKPSTGIPGISRSHGRSWRTNGASGASMRPRSSTSGPPRGRSTP